ncbi:TPA: antiterminator [Cronobacter turicensis]|nr:antiterminator [Cronobacter turicensis]
MTHANEYIRQQLIVALADLSGSTKGQMVAFAENALLITKRYKRKQLKVTDPETGELMAVWNEPVPGVQSRAKGSHIPLVLPVEYATASWRRAVLALEPHETAWLMWCYGANARYAYQMEIVRCGWEAFNAGLVKKRLAGKTLERLRALIWLAAQDVKRELRDGKDACYQAFELAALTGVKADNWSHNYSAYWYAMRENYKGMDEAALLRAIRTRSLQKSTFSQRGVAKINFFG